MVDRLLEQISAHFERFNGSIGPMRLRRQLINIKKKKKKAFTTMCNVLKYIVYWLNVGFYSLTLKISVIH